MILRQEFARRVSFQRITRAFTKFQARIGQERTLHLEDAGLCEWQVEFELQHPRAPVT